jgi:hypothetical protein
MLSNQRHKVYPGSGRGPYVQQWCARGTILLSTGGACSGAATRERRRGLQVPGEVAEDVVGELGNVCVVRRMLSVIRCVMPCLLLVLCCVCPLRRGSSPSIYRPRRG